ncbi:unnamed protein product [Amoebophrya sp. A120]|nr:unnamed protein product [Amoebophrya sp. A120]|eukprot:GSA120T00023573001.1
MSPGPADATATNSPMSSATSSLQPFWGPRNSNVHFCEPAYERSPYIAEFWNALTNLWPILLGLVGMAYTAGLAGAGRFVLVPGGGEKEHRTTSPTSTPDTVRTPPQSNLKSGFFASVFAFISSKKVLGVRYGYDGTTRAQSVAFNEANGTSTQKLVLPVVSTSAPVPEPTLSKTSLPAEPEVTKASEDDCSPTEQVSTPSTKAPSPCSSPLLCPLSERRVVSESMLELLSQRQSEGVIFPHKSPSSRISSSTRDENHVHDGHHESLAKASRRPVPARDKTALFRSISEDSTAYLLCQLTWCCYIGMATGSLLFHATQQFWAEMLDELGMSLTLLALQASLLDYSPLYRGPVSRQLAYKWVPLAVAGCHVFYVYTGWHAFFTFFFTCQIFHAIILLVACAAAPSRGLERLLWILGLAGRLFWEPEFWLCRGDYSLWTGRWFGGGGKSDEESGAPALESPVAAAAAPGENTTTLSVLASLSSWFASGGGSRSTEDSNQATFTSSAMSPAAPTSSSSYELDLLLWGHWLWHLLVYTALALMFAQSIQGREYCIRTASKENQNSTVSDAGNNTNDEAFSPARNSPLRPANYTVARRTRTSSRGMTAGYNFSNPRASNINITPPGTVAQPALGKDGEGVPGVPGLAAHTFSAEQQGGESKTRFEGHDHHSSIRSIPNPSDQDFEDESGWPSVLAQEKQREKRLLVSLTLRGRRFFEDYLFSFILQFGRGTAKVTRAGREAKEGSPLVEDDGAVVKKKM